MDVDVAALCAEAQARLVDEDVDAAVALLTRALDAQPRHSDAALLRSAAYAKDGRYERTVRGRRARRRGEARPRLTWAGAGPRTAVALQDAETVLAADASIAKAHARKGYMVVVDLG